MGLSTIPWVIASLIAAGAFGYVIHCEQVKKNQAAFIQRIEQDAAKQKRDNEDRAKKEKHAKEKADAETKRVVDDLHSTIVRLRKSARTSAGTVPAAPAASSRPDLACFDRAELAAALGKRGEGIDRYRGRVLDLVGEGAENTAALDGARVWALKLSTKLGD